MKKIIMKYPVIFRGEEYTVILKKKYVDILMSEYIEAFVYKGKLRWPFHCYTTMFDIKDYNNKFIDAIKETMHRYAYCILDPEATKNASLKALEEWDGVVNEEI